MNNSLKKKKCTEYTNGIACLAHGLLFWNVMLAPGTSSREQRIEAISLLPLGFSPLLLYENIAKDRKVIPDPIDDRKFQE